MLTQISLGDAIGVGHEYVTGLNAPPNDLTFHQHPLHKDLKPGMYSDDTQQSLILGEMVLDARMDSTEFTNLSVANRFVQGFKRDQRKGYSRGLQSLLEEVSSGKELLSRINEHGRTDKNGAAMRIAPVVYLTDDLDKLFEINEIVSGITHEGTAIDSAACVLVCCWALKYKQASLDEMMEYVKSHFDPKLKLDQPWMEEVKSKDDLGLITVRAAITAVRMSNGTLSDVIKTAIGMTGDVDTSTAIAAAIASQSKDIVDDIIPEDAPFHHVLFQMENNTFGIDYIKNIDKMLEGVKLK